MAQVMAAPGRRGLLATARDFLPAGAGLPESLWRVRHAAVVWLLVAHTVGIPLFALARGWDLNHVVLESLPVPFLTAAAAWRALSRRARAVAASLALLTSSAILVHLSGGVIEMHFHFFVMIGVVSLYQDWIPFITAVGYVLIHHGAVGVLDPGAVYNHQAAVQGPWKWAGIHAGFIGAASVAALVRWRLSEEAVLERQNAEQRLKEEMRIASSLYEVGTLLAADLDGDRVVQAVTDRATELTGAAFGAFFYNVEDVERGAYMLYTLSGAPVEAFSKFDLPRATPIFEPTFKGEGVVRVDDVTQDPRYGQLDPHRGMPAGHLPVRSYLAVSVTGPDGSVIGGLFFGHPEPGKFDATAERMAVGIASHAAVALNNVRRYESEMQARRTAEISADRLELLSEASRALFSSLEPQSVFRAVSSMVTQQLADFCLIDYLEPGQELRRIVDGEISEEARALDVVEPPRPGDAHHPVNQAIQSRQTVFVAAGPQGRPPAAIVVPMIGRHEVLGTLTIGVVHDSTARVTRDDIPVAEELARRAALAIENARLYARQRTLAETLQHSLLPESLPKVPGVDSAAVYAAGGPGVEVGGDWYDVIPLSGGRVGIAVGDVVGRGERAASLMGQLRNALRAYAFDGKGPSATLSGLNTLLSGGGAEHMATLAYGVLDPVAGTLTMANAGHLPVLRLRSGSPPEFLESPPGLPLGALPSSSYQEVAASLEGGDVVLLYTDGLVEERTSSIDAGLERLRQATADVPSDLDSLCQSVAGRLTGGRDSSDDMAILAVRLEPVGPVLELDLDSDPGVLGGMRAAVRRWLMANGADETEVFELLVACGEAATNAIRHAGGPVERQFRLCGEVSPAGEVVISVSDFGGWTERRSEVGGRGLPIIEAYVDRLDVDRRPEGTTVRLTRRLSNALTPALA
jgi:serine phosphatase RsbU (regulator of sigma subunit)/anti-sigma regulatory factor (Ser/Thr protein kinase)/PAS domain-containing protein